MQIDSLFKDLESEIIQTSWLKKPINEGL